MSSAALFPGGARRPLVLADLLPGSAARDLGLVLASSGLVGLAAQLSVPVPGTPVPVTAQTFVVLLCSAALGWRRAGAGMLVYLLAGAVGVPWFAGHSSGWHAPSFGYVVGFVLAGLVVGAMAGRGGDRTPVRVAGKMLLGTGTIYLVGAPYLALDLHLSLQRTWALGVEPFLIGDVIKVVLACGVLPQSWRLVNRGTPHAGEI